MLPVRRSQAIRPRLGGVDSRLRSFARRAAVGAAVVVVAACSSSSSKSTPSTSSVARSTTTAVGAVPTTDVADGAGSMPSMIAGSKFGAGWTGRVMSADETKTADASLRAACPDIATALAKVPAARSRAVYRIGATLPQIVVDQRSVTTPSGTRGRQALAAAVDRLRSAALQQCLLARAGAEPVGLRDTSVTRLDFTNNANAFGYRVRGLSGALTSTVLVVIETIVVAREDTVTIATISSSGRFPSAVTLPTTVVNALDG